MSEPLDLTILLTSPPQGSPPEITASITLRCGALGFDHTGGLLHDPLTQQDRNDLQWYLEEYWKWPYLEFATRGKQVEALLEEVGKRLYHSAFGNSEAQTLIEEWQKQQDVQHQISIVSELPSTLNLPWELLRNEQGFLALHSDQPITIVRRLPQSDQVTLTASFEPPLRILMVTARPRGAGFVDPRSIARELLDEVQESIDAGSIELEFLRPPTLSALYRRLQETQRPIHILHFDGHGRFDERNKHGLLAFEDDHGKLDLVPPEALTTSLHSSMVRLVVLTACKSAVGAGDDAFSSAAAQLLQGGIDAVVAMSASFLVSSAARYVEAFYRALAASTPIQAAQELARYNLYRDARRHLLRRHLDGESIPVELHDWWVPHFYQQRPVLLQATKARHSDESPPQKLPIRRLNEEMPAEPHYGFSGRAREILRIERSLLRGKLMAISGFGGIGKTALACEIADWLTRTGMYEGACFVSFEHGGDATMLLGMLGNFLNVYDGRYSPGDKTASLAQLKSVLKGRRMLVIIDNLESILPGGQALLDEEERTHLWDVLLELTATGIGVLITSRDPIFDDGHLLLGKRVTQLALAGLHPEDAYTLAIRLLYELGIARASVPYSELRTLLRQLGYHPLAIQLVLPVLRELPLSKIRADFAALLPKFADDTTTGRNKSLLASLDYSLQRLSKEQQALLSLLAPFEGGASEVDLQVITEIPPTEWAMLRSALEQAGLVQVEYLPEATFATFLRFHPVLLPFIRSQLQARDAALYDRYKQHYHGLATYFYYEDVSAPSQVRPWVRRELPNLRRTLELLSESDDLEDALEMTEYIVHFLTVLGLWKERDDIRRIVAEAAAVTGVKKGGTMNRSSWFRETGLGEDEWRKGNYRAAYERFTTLLARIEAQPSGTPVGRESMEHCITLGWIAICLRDSGQLATAKEWLREALVIIDRLLKQQPNNYYFKLQLAALLSNLGTLLGEEGKYAQARQVCETAMELFKQLGNLRNQAAQLAEISELAFKQRNYTEAQFHLDRALDFFRRLNEPTEVAKIWHRLGIIAYEREEWAEAERCFREGLAIKELLGDEDSSADTYHQLALLAKATGRFVEAEGWYKLALAVDERIHPNSLKHAYTLNNLAALLVSEIRDAPTTAPAARLPETRVYAERALHILETLGGSSETWGPLRILAEIADLEGRIEVAREYRRKEREAYATFAGNRYRIDREFDSLLPVIALVAKGLSHMRAEVEALFPQLEANNWNVSSAIRGIWAGERDWHTLTEDLDLNSALLVLRVLEVLAQPIIVPPKRAWNRNFRVHALYLSPALRDALERADEAAFERAFNDLSPQEQRAIESTIDLLQAQQSENQEGVPEAFDTTGMLEQFEPLLQRIAAAVRDTSRRSETEKWLIDLEMKGWDLKDAVLRLWEGEREATVLAAGLDEQDAALMQRVLGIMAGT